MVHSMTGFGRAEVLNESYHISCEIKSVNHRYFECFIRLPRSCNFLEERLKRLLQSKVARGKIECYVSIEFLDDTSVEVALNPSVLKGYLNAFEAMTHYGVLNDIKTSSLVRIPDLFQVQKKAVNEEEIWQVMEPAVRDALEKFIAMRQTEGQRLQEDILARAEEILSHVTFIEERSPETVKKHNEKLLVRMQDLLENASIDEQRLLTEAALFADKIAVAEETVRLRSHIEQLRQFFQSPEAIGRKMDFLVQEINREANTIGSKSGDIEITRRVVEMKSNVEKIREQVQNIE